MARSSGAVNLSLSVGAANFWGVGQVIFAINTNSRPTADVLQDVLEEYAIFHGLFAAVCATAEDEPPRGGLTRRS